MWYTDCDRKHIYVQHPIYSNNKYEEQLRAAEDPHGTSSQARARAVILYYSSRMQAVSGADRSGTGTDTSIDICSSHGKNEISV